MEPWWLEIALAAISALATVLTAAAAVLLPMVLKWVKENSSLAGVLVTDTLAKKMDEGVINIIKGLEERLRERVSDGRTHPVSGPVSEKELIERAVPIVEDQFRETIRHVGLDRVPDAVARYVAARVGRARR